MKRMLLLLIVGQSILFANPTSILKLGKSYGRGDDLINNLKLQKVTLKHLSANSKSDNIINLLSLAAKEKRLKSFSSQFKYREVFTSIEKGDSLLLKCLKHQKCDIEKYSNIMTKSSLHRKIALRNPTANVATTNHAVGSINENLMNKYFKSTGWTKIEGEVGRNGIDGLFIKRNKSGNIVDVLVAESKYNKSGLQHTQNGKQMTNQWVLKKIENLKKKYPNNQDYVTIQRFIENSTYRSLLWNLKVDDRNLFISLKKIHDKNGQVLLSQVNGKEKMKINFNGNQEINTLKPNTDFHKQIVGWYKDEIIKL